jgi:hypothetical protein
MKLPMLVLSLGASLCGSAAFAHQPDFAQPGQSAYDTAYVLPDTRVSRVVYTDSACPAAPQVVTFDGQDGEQLFFQLGLPALDPLTTYRPTIALVGPGLPDSTEVPIGLPNGSGALVFSSASGQKTDFFEPFSKTTSWILVERRETLPATGRYYLVIWEPSSHAGRYWVATGEEEKVDFTKIDGPKLASFYRADTASWLGQACTPTQPQPNEAGGGGGCAMSPSGLRDGSLAIALGGLAVVVTRRRSRRLVKG